MSHGERETTEYMNAMQCIHVFGGLLLSTKVLLGGAATLREVSIAPGLPPSPCFPSPSPRESPKRVLVITEERGIRRISLLWGFFTCYPRATAKPYPLRALTALSAWGLGSKKPRCPQGGPRHRGIAQPGTALPCFETLVRSFPAHSRGGV